MATSEAASRLVELAKRQIEAVRLIEDGQPEAALQQVSEAESALSALNEYGNDDSTRLLRGYFYKTSAQAAKMAGDEAAAREHANEAAKIFASIDADGTGHISRDALAGANNGLGNIQALLGDYHAGCCNLRSGDSSGGWAGGSARTAARREGDIPIFRTAEERRDRDAGAPG